MEEGCRKAGRLEVKREKVVETDALMLLAEASMLLAMSLGEAGRAGMRALRRWGVLVRALESSISFLEGERWLVRCLGCIPISQWPYVCAFRAGYICAYGDR